MRWFEKIEPPQELSDVFEPFYVPSKVGRYTVRYPQALGDWGDHAGVEGWRQDAAAVTLNDGRVLLLGGTYGSSEPEALRLAEIFRANVVDSTLSSFVFEITGTPEKIDAFADLMRPIGLVEMARTGVAALSRGAE